MILPEQTGKRFGGGHRVWFHALPRDIVSDDDQWQGTAFAGSSAAIPALIPARIDGLEAHRLCHLAADLVTAELERVRIELNDLVEDDPSRALLEARRAVIAEEWGEAMADLAASLSYVRRE